MSDMMEKGTVNQEVNNDAGASLSAAPADPKTVVVETPNVQATNASQDVIAKLQEYGATPEIISKIVTDLGVETMKELTEMEVGDLTGPGMMKLAKARALLNELKGASAKASASSAGNNTSTISPDILRVLPEVPSDDAWLNALRTGGVLKIDESSYIAAVRATLADQMGLYDIPKKLAKAMEEYADSCEEQLDPQFYAIRKMLTKRDYADLFVAIDGLDGSFITETRRKAFLTRVKNELWPALQSSFQTLNAWQQAYISNASNPGLFIPQLQAAFSGGVAPVPMTVDSSPVHDAGNALADAINHVFRGPGIHVAAALACEANSICKSLENPSLPALIGVPNREMMLKKLESNISANYVRQEQNLVKYVLGFVRHNKCTPEVEITYFNALYQIGMQIEWNRLGGVGNGNIQSVTGSNLL